jgi:predicted dithiol-disulfide oxidoreductase (DUF899 family)
VGGICRRVAIRHKSTRIEAGAETRNSQAKEKNIMHQQDALSADRRRLPMGEIEKAYLFEGPESKVSLCDLFDDRRQLIV